jgi:hypothetical protein
MSRTTNITITNRTSITLSFGNATTAEGPAATANASTVAPGGTLVVTAHNTSAFNGGNKGNFTLSGTKGNQQVDYTFFYTHPQTTGTSYVNMASQTPGWVSGFDADSYGGDPINATCNLYEGVAVYAPGAATGYSVPLSADPYGSSNNAQDFLNQLFDDNRNPSTMRSGALLPPMFDQTTIPYAPADFSGGQIASTLVPILLDVWNNTDTPPPTPDSALLNFLASYIQGGEGQSPMTLWIPILSYVNNTEPAVYTLNGYHEFQLYSQGAWNTTNLRAFLTLLVGGAHMVAISAYNDLNLQGISTSASRSLYEAFRNSGLPQRGDLANSHYASWHTAGGNVTGEYAGTVDGEWAPPACGLLVSLLFGRTVNGMSTDTGQYNTFMQLEGWPAHGTGGTRHMADYDAYQQTLWNISTFGAIPYSEKRATTVFLAPPGWTPTNYQTTGMMPYVGAYATGSTSDPTPQSWLNTTTFVLPPGTPALPAAYIG